LQIQASSSNLTFSADNLPSGLTISNSGLISGSISPAAAVNSPYNVTVTAGAGNVTTSTSFTWQVSSPIVVTVPGFLVQGGAGYPASVQVTASDSKGGDLTFKASGLPPGLDIDPDTGLISGTLATNAAAAAPNGLYYVTVTATDGTYSGSASFVFAVSAPSVSGAVTLYNPGTQHSFEGATVSLSLLASDANGLPVTAEQWSGLPPGLNLNPDTGDISGTITGPPAAYRVTVLAGDGSSTAQIFFRWFVQNPISLTSPGDQVGEAGETIAPLAVQASDANGRTLKYSAAGLPPGLQIDSASGVVSGTIAGGASSQDFADLLPLVRAKPHQPDQPGDQVGEAGETIAPLAVQASDANGRTLKYSAAGLPPGLQIDSASGVVSGTIAGGASSQDFPVTLTATDGSYSQSVTFTWSVSNPIALTNPGPQTSMEGQPVSLLLNWSDAASRAIRNFSANGLPPGLAIYPATGQIYGKPDATASQRGPYLVTVTASDGVARASISFPWLVSNPIQIVSPGPQSSPAGQAINALQLRGSDASGGPGLTWSANGLPPGLTLSASGLLQGTPTTAGTYRVSIEAQDGLYWSMTTFTWVVGPDPYANLPSGLRQALQQGYGPTPAEEKAFDEAMKKLFQPQSFADAGLFFKGVLKGIFKDGFVGTLEGVWGLVKAFGYVVKWDLEGAASWLGGWWAGDVRSGNEQLRQYLQSQPEWKALHQRLMGLGPLGILVGDMLVKLEAAAAADPFTRQQILEKIGPGQWSLLLTAWKLATLAGTELGNNPETQGRIVGFILYQIVETLATMGTVAALKAGTLAAKLEKIPGLTGKGKQIEAILAKLLGAGAKAGEAAEGLGASARAVQQTVQQAEKVLVEAQTALSKAAAASKGGSEASGALAKAQSELSKAQAALQQAGKLSGPAAEKAAQQALKDAEQALAAARGAERAAQRVPLALAQGCFAAGTPVQTPAGYKAIEELRIGDVVLSADENDPKGPVLWKRVVDTHTRLSGVIAVRAGGKVIAMTEEHPVFVVGEGWVAAYKLRPGQRLRSDEGPGAVVEEVCRDVRVVPVYNVTVEDYHTYFVGGPDWGFSVWVHNQTICQLRDQLRTLEAELTAARHAPNPDATRIAELEQKVLATKAQLDNALTQTAAEKAFWARLAARGDGIDAEAARIALEARDYDAFSRALGNRLTSKEKMDLWKKGWGFVTGREDRAAGVELHHIMTDKNRISTVAGGPFTPKFEELCRKRGISLQDARNVMDLPGHRGPHPAYDAIVWKRLSEATDGLEGPAFNQAFDAALKKIREETETPGTLLNRLATGQGGTR
jgi:hypothetical protein